MMNVLIVRTSSMGDLIHTWPAVTDLVAHYSNVELSWLAEEAFADIAALHPAVGEVIPIAWRRWRKALLAKQSWQQMAAMREALRARPWDCVIDSQGLLKSALPAKLAGGPLAGYDSHSIREPLASRFYDKQVSVSRELSAIERNRRLFAGVFGYAVEGPPRFGVGQGERPSWLPDGPYAVLLHATSKASKEWPEQHWVDLGARLAAEGLVCVLPWGNAQEAERAARLQAAIEGAVLAPRMRLREAAGLIGHAAAVVGVDTGLTHLANAQDVPLVAIYTDTDPALTGVVETARACNVGRAGVCPEVDEVYALLQARRTA